MGSSLSLSYDGVESLSHSQVLRSKGMMARGGREVASLSLAGLEEQRDDGEGRQRGRLSHSQVLRSKGMMARGGREVASLTRRS